MNTINITMTNTTFRNANEAYEKMYEYYKYYYDKHNI